ncbi:hypothetical protein [Adlercreutzia sp. ZJ473]|uniref:hypothetical protein n=1 Tax=Adlercreutzia sp. ZJ473 TaxID=2722822 RepID=UPI001554747F|nr:hypothetical protein [Adlercreutzia sp. ZJ473]
MAPRLLCGRSQSADYASDLLIGQIDRCDCLYYAAFAVYLIQYTLETSNFMLLTSVQVPAFCNTAKVACAFLLLLKLLTQRYGRREIARIGLIGALTVCCLCFSQSQHLGFISLFIVAAQGVSMRKMVRIALVVQSSMFVLVVASSLDGLIPMTVVERGDGGARYSMGYKHPNNMSLALVSICCNYMVLHYAGMRRMGWGIYGIALTLCATVSDSRTSMMLILLIVTISAYGEKAGKAKNQGNVSRLFFSIYVLIALLSLFFMFFYNEHNSLEKAVNGLVSSRFELAHKYYEYYGISPFGVDCDADPVVVGRYALPVIDNAFANAFIRYGLLPTALFLTAYGLRLKRACDSGRVDICTLGLFVCAVMAVTETQAFHLGINVYLIGLAQFVFCDADVPSLWRVPAGRIKRLYYPDEGLGGAMSAIARRILSIARP